MADKVLVWKQVHGLITPGGDPYWECPVCGEGGHLYGVECPKNYTHECRNCGSKVIYPWEVEE